MSHGFTRPVHGDGRSHHSGRRPLYARLLGLRHLKPSGLQCLLLGEGSLALGVLLALAELTSWWAVLVVPLTVAGMVKINEVVAGASVTDHSATPDHSATSDQGATPGGDATTGRRGWAANPPGERGAPALGRATVAWAAVGRAVVVSSVDAQPALPRQRRERAPVGARTAPQEPAGSAGVRASGDRPGS